MSEPSKGPPADAPLPRTGNEVTLEIADYYGVDPVAEVARTLVSKARGDGPEFTDSVLIRVRDGHTIQVLAPRKALPPEERYQLPSAGDVELGKGGIGQVHLVFDSVLGREVAMKVLRDEYRQREESEVPNDDTEVAWRFMREARVTGQLEHPNIVPVYELGRRADGSLYYTMRAVRGRTLGEAIRNSNGLIERLGLLHHFADVCQAIGYAHSRGVLHRDIKPENVMIGEYGETFVLDWGLARVQSHSDANVLGKGLSLPPDAQRAGVNTVVDVEGRQCTALGSVVGTPHYMSPEQITTPSGLLDARADVWSLGVVLYSMLAGRTPFQGKNVAEILSNVLTAPIVRPSELDALVPPELEAIALRALERNAAQRYADAGEMAKDIVAFQSGARVGAYAYGSLELLRRFGRRHRQAVRVAAAALMILIVMAVASYVRVRRARDIALDSERRATAGQRLANLRYADILVEKARNAATSNNLIEARLYAAEALSVAERPEARGLLLGLSNATELRPTRSISIPEACTMVIAGSTPTDFLCVTASVLTYLRDGAKRWASNIAEPRMLARLGGDTTAVLSVDGRWSVISDSHGEALATGDSPLALPSAFVGTPDNHFLAMADKEGNIVVWQPDKPDMLRLKWGQSITALAFTRSGRSLIIGGSYGRIGLWPSVASEPARIIGETHTTVESLVAGPRDSVAVAGGSDGTVSIWDIERQQLIGTALKHESAVNTLALSVNGRWLATGTRAMRVDLVDMQQRTRVFSIPEARGSLVPLRFGADGKLWVMNKGRELIAFDVIEPRPRARLLDRSNVLSLAWSPNSELIYSGGLHESGVCVFRLSDGACADRLPVKADHLRSIAVSPDGKYLVFGGTGKSLEIWDANNRIPLAIVAMPIEDVRSVVFDTRQGGAWISGNAPYVLGISLPSGKEVARFAVDGLVQSMVMTADQRNLLLGLRDGRLQIRQTTGALVKESAAHRDWVTGVGVIGKTNTAVSVGGDGATIFWRLPTLAIIQQRREHQGRATALAISLDGRLVATAGEDPVIVVSEATAPWQERLELHDHHGTIRCLAFEPNNRQLASGGDDATVRLWNLKSLDVDVDRQRAELSADWHLTLAGSAVSSERAPSQASSASNVTGLPAAH